MRNLYIATILILCTGFLYAESELSTKGLTVKQKEVVMQSRDIKTVDQYRDAKRWAICIGVNDYEDKFISDLDKAQNDAKVLADVLTHEGQFDYVFLFTDDTARENSNYASMNNIVAKMEFLKDQLKPDDTLVISFSGHGISDDNGRSYLLLADSVISQPYKTSLPVYEIENWIDETGVMKNIVLLDACRNVVEKTKGMNQKTLIAEKDEQAEVSAIIYSTSTGEFSYEHNEEPYGVFTTFLIKGLRGSADKDSDVMITFNELRDYVESGVNEWSIRNNKKQKPFTRVNGEFHGDVVMSVIPLKERSKYNPNLLTSSYNRQMTAFKATFGAGLAIMVTGLISSSVCGVLLGVGYYQYDTLAFGSPKADFDLYGNMYYINIFTTAISGGIGILAMIPLIVSFAIKPKVKKQSKIAIQLDLGGGTGSAYVGMKIRL